ncbi:helix-turn-helix domain-containing protein [Klebsiella aerogenes]
MTGYELRLWRKSLGWSRDRAAEELGVSLRTYKDYENADLVRRVVELATVTLSLKDLLPVLKHRNTAKNRAMTLLQNMLP